MRGSATAIARPGWRGLLEPGRGADPDIRRQPHRPACSDDQAVRHGAAVSYRDLIADRRASKPNVDARTGNPNEPSGGGGRGRPDDRDERADHADHPDHA
jgi:hypothetical protein